MTLVAAVLLFWWGTSEQLSSRTVASIQTGEPVDLWFTPRGELASLVIADETVTVRTWNAQGRLQRTRSLDFPLSRPRQLPSQSPVQQSLRRRRPGQEPPQIYQEIPEDIPLFAVSRDASTLAWVQRENLYIQNLTNEALPPPLVRKLETRTPVSGIQFTEDSRFALLRSDGHLELRNIQGERVDLAMVRDGDRPSSKSLEPLESWSLWSSGPFLTVVSFPTAQAVVFDTRGPLKTSHWHYELGSRNGLGLVVSPSGRLAVGTSNGTVLLSRPEKGGRVDVIREAPGIVTAITFYDENRTLVGGDFRGIYLVSSDQPLTELTSESVGTRLLAINPTQWAFSGNGGSMLMAHQQMSRLNATGTATIAAWVGGGVLAVVYFAAPWLAGLLGRASYGFGTPPLPRAEDFARRSDDASPDASTLTPVPPPDPPEPLVEAIARGDCILYIGAGLSAQAGLPTWVECLEGLIRFAREHEHLSDEIAQRLTRDLLSGGRSAVADELASVLPRELLQEYLGTGNGKVRPSPAHELLAKMPFAGVVNTNFDRLIARAFNKPDRSIFVPDETEELLQILREKQFFIVNLNGTVEKPSTLIFTQREYRDAMVRNLPFRQWMQTLFARRTFFFLGVSLNGILEYLEALELSPLLPAGEHFALVDEICEPEDTQVRALKRNFGINLVGFRPLFGHPEIVEFLEKLRAKVDEKGPPEVLRVRPVLKRVVLQNIGPFESLDVELSASWNVLLGDNGMGKSVVLRSIAAALCGEAAEEAAVTRLLRSGSREGSIELYVGSERYRVELQRDLDGRVHIKSASLSPLKLGNWLVLGFPALRSVTWDRPKGPSAVGGGMPSPADLLPILSSTPDTRMNDLKQWLINTHYKASGDGQEADVGRRLLDRFFQVLDEITPDIELKFHSIDKDTREIRLQTDGGVVPLEAVSQGTVSVTTWVGTLLQRLYEAYGSLPAPEREGALVLVDEIDAHMHPGWQRSLALQLRELFPEVQVVATTHSPLIVAALAPEEILLARRHPADRRILIEKPEMSLQGLRADQILTSPLFKLESTRDPETHRRLMRYSDLATRDQLLPEQEAELQALARELEIRLPAPAEREEARQAMTMIEDALDERLKKVPIEKQKKVLQEAKVLWQEIMTGSRRPQ